VWVCATAAGVVNANDNEILFYPEQIEAENEYVYITAVMVADKVYPYPYTATSSSAAAPCYLLQMPASGKFTLRIVVHPFFNYDTVVFPRFWEWYIDANHRFMEYYDANTNKISVYWKDGTDARQLYSQEFDDGTSLTDINQWLIIDAAIDLTTGTTAGSQIWINRVSKDTTWSGNIDAKTSYFPVASLGHGAGAAQADSLFSYAILIPDYVATNADVQNDYRDVKEKQIYWSFNGEGCGRSRCDVSRHVGGYMLAAEADDAIGGGVANTLDVELLSPQGEFAGDQYATFDCTIDQFNGTSSQKYMQSRTPVILETWYDHDFEPVFVGRVDDALYSRSTPADDISVVSISCEDMVSEIARAAPKNGSQYLNYALVDPADEANSLLHSIVRLATKQKITNYLANSSFENATIGNSWTVSGAGAALTRETGGLFGTYCGQLVYGSANAYVYQYVTFIGTKKLNVGETYTYAIFLKSASTCADIIYIEERDSGGVHATSKSNFSLTGGAGWKIFEVSHTITDSTSDRLTCGVRLNDNVTLLLDEAMLTQTARAPLWFVLNNNDGAAGVESADDADWASYDTLGFDTDLVDITHGCVNLKEYASPWEEVKRLAVATAARICGIDSSGCFRFRSPLAAGYSDPPSMATIEAAVALDTSVAGSGAGGARANKLIVHGEKIKYLDKFYWLWDLKASRLWEPDLTAISIADGENWPTTTEFPEFWAEYSDTDLSVDIETQQMIDYWTRYTKAMSGIRI
jgi:hypothetical protein